MDLALSNQPTNQPKIGADVLEISSNLAHDSLQTR